MNWEPWTGCYKASDGCTYCYFYGPYAKRYGQNIIEKTDKFDWPVRRNAKGQYNIKGNKILATCFATDFFLPEADEWRKEVWAMIREIAARINELNQVLARLDWKLDGYEERMLSYEEHLK